MNLTEFLLARIAEDEAAVRAATQGKWEWSEESDAKWPQGEGGLFASGWQVYLEDKCQGDLSAYTRGELVDHLHAVLGETRTYKIGVPGKHEHSSRSVIGSWGYDAWGIDARDEDRAYIVRWQPSRALAECETKRRIASQEQSACGGYDRDPASHYPSD